VARWRTKPNLYPDLSTWLCYASPLPHHIVVLRRECVFELIALKIMSGKPFSDDDYGLVWHNWGKVDILYYTDSDGINPKIKTVTSYFELWLDFLNALYRAPCR
jgi:hypothetical protein